LYRPERRASTGPTARAVDTDVIDKGKPVVIPE
jgi:hypothetical protein